MEDIEEEMTGDVLCSGCSSVLIEPYIRCIQCSENNVQICLHCFANGVEFDNHESNHSYIMIRNDFSIFEKRWTAMEEINLLKAIEEYGYGNWKEIADQVKSKSGSECERHYNKHYIDNPTQSLPEFTEPEISFHPAPIVFKLCDDPPRPSEGSTIINDMGGYFAARGDFTIEYDNYCELDISQIDDVDDNDDDDDDEDSLWEEDKKLMSDLKFAAVQIYHTCLKERDRRKKIIRDYGLINMSKIFVTNKRYERTIRSLVDGLRCFSTLFTPIEYDQYLETLHYERELKQEIMRLKEYRQNGITKLRNIRLFKVLNKRREVTRSKRHLLSDLLTYVQDEDNCKSWLQRQAFIETMSKGGNVPLPTAPRKAPAPLDITGYPGYDKLSQNDKEICTTIRLVPEAFMEFKKVLIKECQKLGCLKLAQARSLIKIDVNKTRKLYDHLISDGTINKDPL
ncbi:transcriptional adapter 2-alpha [Patella vulgata]|uniref:transcriptional adapter 2-alpha n=1 Tax=Patella vulgata TaxID=6465 RepID=UPI00217FFD8C|nr:transcriptional adapter 2-alpha [Patella vulgata]XP_050409919.1 transcriptional adapter 2-alpha [Patella vulgata]XP_050409921.1 transcriptional adapter 2-alpha [Patella vulgata]